MSVSWPRALQVAGMVAAAVGTLALLPSLLRTPEPPPLDPRIGLTGIEEPVEEPAVVRTPDSPAGAGRMAERGDGGGGGRGGEKPRAEASGGKPGHAGGASPDAGGGKPGHPDSPPPNDGRSDGPGPDAADAGSLAPPPADPPAAVPTVPVPAAPAPPEPSPPPQPDPPQHQPPGINQFGP